MKQFIGERIKPELNNIWEDRVIVLIKAGTGMGKTTFAMTDLYEKAASEGKRILILQNRRAAETQFIEEVKKRFVGDVITIAKYQDLEHKVIMLSMYHYIVCDEAHYFATDCSFNPRTDDSFNQIMAMKDRSQLVFMTATGEGVFEAIKSTETTRDYFFESDHSGISSVELFSSSDYIPNKLNEITNSCRRKAIVFLDRIDELMNVFGQFNRKAMFVCSKSRKEYISIMDEQLVKEMTDTRILPKQILFATSALDTGFNLEDKYITDVFCSSPDIYKIIQWIGRVRIQDGQQITVHIKDVNKHHVGGKLTQLLEVKNQMETLKRSQVEFRKLMRKEDLDARYFFITPETPDIQLNKLAEIRVNRQISFYQSIVGGTNFTSLLEAEFGDLVRNTFSESELNRVRGVCQKYLDVELNSANDKQLFFEELNLKKRYSNRKIVLLVNIDEINSIFNKIGYKLESRRDSRTRSLTVKTLYSTQILYR